MCDADVKRDFELLYSLTKQMDIPLSIAMDFKMEYKCFECKSKNLVYDDNICETTCLKCAMVQPFNMPFIPTWIPDTFSKIKKSIYKPLNYLDQRLEELQCKRVVVKDEMLTCIMKYLKNKPPTIKLVRLALRKNGYKQFYLQIPTIMNTLNPEKWPPLRLSAIEFRRIRRYFCKYIEEFYSIPLKERMYRKNILNYQFVLSKLFDIIGKPEYKVHLILPQGKKTLKTHQEIWDKIVDKLTN